MSVAFWSDDATTHTWMAENLLVRAYSHHPTWCVWRWFLPQHPDLLPSALGLVGLGFQVRGHWEVLLHETCAAVVDADGPRGFASRMAAWRAAVIAGRCMDPWRSLATTNEGDARYALVWSSATGPLVCCDRTTSTWSWSPNGKADPHCGVPLLAPDGRPNLPTQADTLRTLAIKARVALRTAFLACPPPRPPLDWAGPTLEDPSLDTLQAVLDERHRHARSHDDAQLPLWLDVWACPPRPGDAGGMPPCHGLWGDRTAATTCRQLLTDRVIMRTHGH